MREQNTSSSLPRGTTYQPSTSDGIAPLAWSSSAPPSRFDETTSTSSRPLPTLSSYLLPDATEKPMEVTSQSVGMRGIPVRRAVERRLQGELRYLMEEERLEIIRRLENGARQSDLAKEYAVTRAAISNTFKNRSIIRHRVSQSMLPYNHILAAEYAKLRGESSSGQDGRPDATLALADGSDTSHHSSSNRQVTAAPYGAYRRRGAREPISPYSRRPSPQRDQEADDVSMVDSGHNGDEHKPYDQVDGEADTSLLRAREPMTPLIEEMQSPAVMQLLTRLRDRSTPWRAFQQTADRLIRLLLEETLALAPTVPHHVTTSSGEQWEGICRQRECIGVSVNNGGLILQRIFKQLMPEALSGEIFFAQTGNQEPTVASEVNLPSNLHATDVVLMAGECVKGAVISHAIEILQSDGVAENAIYFICPFISAVALHRIHQEFPSATIVTASIEPEVDAEAPRLRPGVGGFVRRYHGMQAMIRRRSSACELGVSRS